MRAAESCSAAGVEELPDEALQSGAGGEGSGSPAPMSDPAQIDVEFSSVNYKDALAVTGVPGILRQLPLIAGIDAVGTLREGAAGLPAGSRVLVNGAGLGEVHNGGLAERAVAPEGVLVLVPDRFSAAEAATIGTAGFTAALAVLRLEQDGVHPGSGEVLVTGAVGGVGGFAVALLAARGFSVIASTGRPAEREYLRELGASEVVNRADLAGDRGKPLQRQRWAGVVDSVGGVTLGNAVAQTRPGGVVAACGLAQSADLPLTVLPFILRGVTLAGINSVDASLDHRRAAWRLLAQFLPDFACAALLHRTVGLVDAVAAAGQLLRGEVRGRVLVDVRA